MNVNSKHKILSSLKHMTACYFRSCFFTVRSCNCQSLQL